MIMCFYCVYIDAKLLRAPRSRDEKLVLLLYYYRHGFYSVSELIYEENNYYSLQRSVYFSHYISGTYFYIYLFDFQKHYNSLAYTVYGAYRAVALCLCTHTNIRTSIYMYTSSKSLVNNKILFPFSGDKKKEKEIIFVWLQHAVVRGSSVFDGRR